mgnify:CR=1 FL=1
MKTLVPYSCGSKDALHGIIKNYELYIYVVALPTKKGKYLKNVHRNTYIMKKKEHEKT